MEVLATLRIPQHISQIQLTKGRRAKYYTTEDPRVVNYPKKYQTNQFQWIKKGKQEFWYLVDLKTKQRVKSNEALVNKPRFWTINGNSIMSAIGYETRNTVLRVMKEYLKEKITAQISCPITVYPIGISAIMCELPKQSNWDIGNINWVWYKALEDALQEAGIITNDNINFIQETGAMKYIEASCEEDRYLQFLIYKI